MKLKAKEMKSNIESIKLMSDVILPDGKYKGIWSGYQVDLVIDDNTFQIRTKNGIRGINIPCIINVVDGKIEVTTD